MRGMAETEEHAADSEKSQGELGEGPVAASVTRFLKAGSVLSTPLVPWKRIPAPGSVDGASEDRQ
jgi:hypothetical protein